SRGLSRVAIRRFPRRVRPRSPCVPLLRTSRIPACCRTLPSPIPIPILATRIRPRCVRTIPDDEVAREAPVPRALAPRTSRSGSRLGGDGRVRAVPAQHSLDDLGERLRLAGLREITLEASLEDAPLIVRRRIRRQRDGGQPREG